MSKKNCCVSIYPTHRATERALSELQKAGVDLRQVSIAGKGCQSEAHPIGFYNVGDRIRYRGLQGNFWVGLWGLLSGAAFFWVPGFGPLAAAGPFVDSLMCELDGVAIGGGFSVFGAALYNMGIPRDSINRYEQVVKADQCLLIVHGERDAVEQACEILHSETQQVTVHRA